MSIVLFIIGLSLLIIAHEFGHFFAAKRLGLLVEEFGIGFPPRLFKLRRGETVYSINAIPFGGFVKIAGEVLSSPKGEVLSSPKGEKPDEPSEPSQRNRLITHRPAWQRAVVMVAGVVMNFIAGWLLLAAVLMIGIPPGVVITGIAPNSPAATAGIEAGDLIVGYETSEAFSAFIQDHAGQEITLALTRSGDEQRVTLTPRANPPEGEGALGVSIADTGLEAVNPARALWQGLMGAGAMLWGIVAGLGMMIAGIFTGGAGLEDLAGPVGIFQIGTQAASFGVAALLQFFAIISINLTVLNLLPVPALDGGRLLFLLIEKIKGSPIAQKREAIANLIGFALLLLLMLVITVRDVARLL